MALLPSGAATSEVSQEALSEGLLPDLWRVLRPCHPSGDLGHVCATAGPKAHLFPTREPENGSVLMTALPSSSF